MKKVSKLIVLAALALIAGGAFFLVTGDLPAPTGTIEKIIPDDRFPR
jgi:hypothetical protein